MDARSVAAAAIDGVTGELFQFKLTPSFEHIRAWVADLPGPVAVAYEAGPTGFGLYRSLMAAGIRSEGVAPSKLQRPAGDPVKTDAKDALHLARLLSPDEITAVAIPTLDQEAARDVVRAREDARGDLARAREDACGDLMRARHVAAPGGAGAADLGRDPAVVRLRLRGSPGGVGPPRPVGHRHRGDGRRQPVHRGRAPAGLPARGQHPDRVRVGRRDR